MKGEMRLGWDTRTGDASNALLVGLEQPMQVHIYEKHTRS